MPEHTIPGSLIENIRSGRAALVVGAGFGIASWKQLLERMNERLRTRGQLGDEDAAKDVDKLLHKGSLVRAAGFLGRTLGEQVCDQIAKETWQTPSETPAIAAALAQLPFRQMWTTFPGNALETAAALVRPQDWPELRVATYQEIDDVNRRRRTLVKVLGDFNSYVVTPKSVRKALSGAATLRDYIREFYSDGSLVFVGFRYGDPDLAALLDRVFGQFEPPDNDHYLVASGVGPVTVEELMNEHHIKVVNLAGKGADDTAQTALLEYLDALRLACDNAGVTLAQRRPDEDDLEGWLDLLGRDFEDPEAQSALGQMESKALANRDYERLIELYLSKVELEDSPRGRAALLRKVAGVYEHHIGDLPRAFTALTAAVREDPSDTSALDEAERLAEATDGWTELVADVSAAVADIDDRSAAASYWVRLGQWYDKKLRHLDYAIAAYREAIKLSPTLSEAYDGLVHVLRKQQRWADLADTLSAHVDVCTELGKQVELYLAMGELYETQLASTSKAIESYEMAAELEERTDEALCALERLYRRDERWSKLAQVLESRASFFDAAGDVARAQAVRSELAGLRADKLGDLEGTIKKHETTLERDERNLEALRALEDLYDKAGRAGDYLKVLATLAEVTTGKSQVAALRKLATEVEKRHTSPEQAVEAYQKLIELAPESADAQRGLARALRQAGRWYELVEALESQIAETSAPAPKAELLAELAEVYERELDDPHKAIDGHLKALALVASYGPSLTALARLYQQTENWDRALEVLARHAEAEQSADLWRQAGSLAADRSSDLEVAQGFFGKALELDAGHVPTLMALAKLYRRAGEHERAAKQLLLAERHSQNRDQRVAFLTEAADLYRRQVKDDDRALRLLRKVLELDPEDAGAAEGAVAIYVAQKRFAEAMPILEGLVASASDPVERAGHMVSLGNALCAAGDYLEAAAKFDAAAELHPSLVGAHIGRSRARFEHAKQGDDEMLWRDVGKLYDELLAKFRTQLDGEAMAEVWLRHGVAARATGDLGKAEASLRKALECNPRDVHALGVLAEIAAQKGDYRTVVDARRNQLKLVDDARKLQLLEEIGDVYVEHLKMPAKALEVYQEGIALDPKAHVLLHKTLEVYTAQRDWLEAVHTLDALAATETETKRRAKYHYAAAVIARDELKDRDIALEKFSMTLDDDSGNAKAFEAIDKLLAVGDDYKALARAYRQMIRRVGEEAPAGRLIRLWSRLGEICAEHLGDSESAMAAYEVAVSLDPDDMDRHEQLVNLYLEAGEARRKDAIRELHTLIDHQPDRAELYHALFGLYEQEGDVDRLFCIAQALVLLGAATPTQQQLYETLRPQNLKLAKRRLTEELWQKAVSHQRENRHLSAIFSSVVGALAATTARPASAYNLDPHSRADLESDGRLVSKVVKYGTDVLGLELKPQLYINQTGEDGLRVANTAEHGRLVPSVMVGPGMSGKKDQRELAFEVGKRLAYFRPERYVNYALQGGLPKLQQAYAAVLAATGAPGAEKADSEARVLADRLRKSVPGPVLEQVGAVARKLKADPNNGVIAGWRTATDLTANRVGFILCNDLETAAKMVATESSPLTTMSAKDRLRDLIAYSASEEYFAVRRHLGLAMSDEKQA